MVIRANFLLVSTITPKKCLAEFAAMSVAEANETAFGLRAKKGMFRTGTVRNFFFSSL
jgi:hypothetical protein